jgi:hygromycin-B 7''-O-kinase
VEHSLQTIEKIKSKHRLSGEAMPLAFMGDVNEAWAIGDEFILRINRREECDDEAAREKIVVPLVRAAGIRTPELIACDYEKDIVPRPYTIYRRAHGVMLGNLDIDPASLPKLYRELGRELAALHRMPIPKELSEPKDWQDWDNSNQIDRALAEAKISANERDDIAHWMESLRKIAGERKFESLVHKDIHPWNLLVDPKTHELNAILDWGDCMIGEVGWEFASMPLVAVPAMMDGYREAGDEITASIIAKSLISGIGLAIWELRVGTPETYRRQWWRLPVGGWEETKQFIRANFSDKIPIYLRPL